MATLICTTKSDGLLECRHNSIVSTGEHEGQHISAGHLFGAFTRNHHHHQHHQTASRRKSCVTPSNSATVGPTQMFCWFHRSAAALGPLVDVSTPSGMHSSCSSFAGVTDDCLLVCKIRSPVFLFFCLCLRFFFFNRINFLFTKKEAMERRGHRGQTRASCFFL